MDKAKKNLILLIVGTLLAVSCGRKGSDKENSVLPPGSADSGANPGNDTKINIKGDKDAKVVEKPQTVSIVDLVKQGDQRGVERELTAGAELNSRDDQGKTLLMLAVTYNRFSICKMLVEKGADIQLFDNENSNAIGIGKSLGYDHIATYLEQSLKAQQQPGDTTNPVGHDQKPHLTAEQLLELNNKILDACEKGELDNIAAFVELGADANFASSSQYSGMTPLFIAINKGNVELVQLLINLKADVTKKVALRRLGEKTPLEYAEYRLQKEGANAAVVERFKKIIASLKG